MSSAAGTLTLVRSSQVGGTQARRNKVACCHDDGRRCPNAVKWIIDRKYFCYSHAEQFWDAGNFVENHNVIRLNTFNEEKPFKSEQIRRSEELQLADKLGRLILL